MPDRSSEPCLARSKSSERGAALVLFTIMLALVILPMLGLAIDCGMAYFAHERLVSAADAAALAGARSLNIGITLDQQAANVQSIAAQYFRANFPLGILGSSNAKVTVPPPLQTSYHTVTIQVQASTVIPFSFLGLIGYPNITLSTSASTSRRDVNVVLALDRSGSMDRVCGIMKSDAENFVSKFVNGRDTVGLITFMGNADLDYPSTKNFDGQTPSLNTTLGTLNCGGNTGSAAALSLARTQLKSVAVPGALNVIVFFTDGVPNGFLADFQLLNSKTCPDLNGKPSPVVRGYIAEAGGMYNPTPQPLYSTATPVLTQCPNGSFGQLAKSYAAIPETDAFNNSASATGYAPVLRDGNNQIVFSPNNSDAVSKNAADDAARQIRNDGIVIYTIGLDGDGGFDSKLLQRIANDPASNVYNPSQPAGKYYYSPNAGQLGAAFDSIASQILRISQ